MTMANFAHLTLFYNINLCSGCNTEALQYRSRFSAPDIFRKGVKIIPVANILIHY